MSRIYVHSLDAPMGFGKYASRTLRSVSNDDPSYVVWCAENLDGFAFDTEAADYARGAIPGMGYMNVADEESRGCFAHKGYGSRYDDEEEIESVDDDGYDDPYDIDYSCYDDQLDPDQQDKEFWDQF